ncbi:MAG: proprotein convertase P-domain-containing protein, partial [Planctomycetota bacterium]|nr:proprotein convertase P-domain-containing protein [Planctomycetota bacterium]
MPNVSVQPVALPDGTLSLTQFEITFDGKISGSIEGSAGKKDHPELVVIEAVDELGASWIDSPEIDVLTLKEPSPEFRVNPEEPEDVFTPHPDKYDQLNAVVAMDADGDFVIAWQSEIGEAQDSGNVFDIYARRFTPIGLTAPEHVVYVPGIMAKGDAFRVNTKTTGPQVNPSIGMDDDGNFAIAWSSTSQDISFFNSVRARQYTREGVPVGDEFLVNTEDTQIHSDPYVGMSHDGNTVITWNTGLAITAKIYDSTGSLIDGPFNVGSGVNHSTTFDKQNRFVVTYETGTLQDPDNVGQNSIGTRAIMYRLFDAAGNVNRTVVRDTFRPNSASFDPDADTLWPGRQQNPQAGLDADGDLVIAYDGFGPDVSDYFYLGSNYFAKAMSDPANADLLAFFPGGSLSLSNSIDVDTAIELVLIDAANQGATLSQLGRIRAILDSKAALLRGEANGVMYSRFDADPPTGAANILASDSVVNAKRDGHNAKYLIAIDTAATGGTFAARLWNSFTSGFETITFNPVFTNNVLNIAGTRDDIHNKLEAATRTGVNWPEPQYDGVVDVRVVSAQEIFARQVTLSDGSQPWRYPTAPNTVVFEVTFQGEVHDSYIDLVLSANALTPAPQTVQIIDYQAADSGTTQTDVSLAMQTQGDFTLVWLQHEERTWDTSGYPDSYYSSANQNIYYRRFDESVDAAGPRITDLVDEQGNLVPDGGTIEGPVRYIVVPFDEPLLAGDPGQNPDSVLNTNNWVLTQNGVEIPFGVVDVQFGMNKAAELAGQPDAFGGTYELSEIPTNKWEAVLTLDANGGLVPGVFPLGSAEYRITALSPSALGGISGVRDLAGNPLGSLGPAASGVPMGRTFAVHIDAVDTPVDPIVGGADRITGTLYPESPNAVAVDADGDYVMVWTAYDTDLGRDRLFMRCYDADGTPADLPLLDGDKNVIGTRIDAFPIIAVTPPSTHPELMASAQRFGSVAIDPDGDFVITWTNYTEGDGDIYARAFPARAGILGLTDVGGFEVPVISEDVTEAFRVNGSMAAMQKWSDVAMDVDGNFVITWTNDSRATGATTSDYDVYARRYNAAGENLGRQILVNVTTTGNQRLPSIAMAALGDFVIAWQSDENGVDDDIYAREFNADGTPKAPPVLVNDITVGHQRYPDVAMRFDGEAYVVTWTDSAADTSGTSVWAEISGQQPRHYFDPYSHVISQTHQFSIDVPDSFTIADVNLQLGLLTHTRLEDLEVSLQSPSGATVVLFSSLPKPLVDGSRPAGNTLDHTIFDDEAPTGVSINNSDRGAVPNYEGAYVPQEALAAFVGEDAQGTWTLIVQDRNPGNNETGSLSALSPEIGSWSLDITDVNAEPSSFQVNSTNEGHQMYSSVAMDTPGNFVITWSGKGNQPMQSDPSGHGVYYQRYHGGGTRLGGETRVNRQTDGNQWMSSIGMDTRGNFVIGWTGVGTLPGTTAVYKYDSASNFQRPDLIGPIVSDVLAEGERLPNDGKVEVDPDEGLQTLTVVFDEALSTVGGASGLHSVLNPNNWAIVRNNSEIVGGIQRVDFGLNPLTNKYEAIVTFDGNGVNFGTAPLKDGVYVLTVRDLITDGSALVNPATGAVISTGNALDGDYNGIPGASPTTFGLGGYEHRFTIESRTSGPGPGPEPDPNDPDSDRPVTGDDDTFPPGGPHLSGENRGAVAADADGHHVVVFTATDDGKERVYFRRFNPDGSPGDDLGPIPVLQGAANAGEFAADDQRYAAVALDADGDFVVTWTNLRAVTDAQGNPVIDPITGMPKVDADIYARRFNAKGAALSNVFRVNTYTKDNQIWPSVAMDVDGDFIVTWASYAQERGGQPGSGYGIYARRFDSAGQPLAPEFLVNVTIAGNQRYPSIDMSSQGDFVIAWQSEQGANFGDDVIARVFHADGSPRSSLSRGEVIVNDTRLGNQRYPDVAFTPDGNNFVVTWTASGAQDGSGEAVFGQMINVSLLDEQGAVDPVQTYASDTTARPFGYGTTITSTIEIPDTFPDAFTINDINLMLNIQHASPRDVQVRLISPSGTEITLFANVPRSGVAGADFIDTLFDDEADISILDPTATPPFINTLGYRPEQPLSAFDGQLTSGTWTLIVQDVDRNDPAYPDVSGVFNGWSLEIERVPERSGEFLVNSTTVGDQSLSSVDFNNQGDFVIAWQGNGITDDGQDVTGIFFQRFGFTLERIGAETRANKLTSGEQIFPSVASDNAGQFVIVWQGPGLNPGSSEVYRYLSRGVLEIDEEDGPWVTGVSTKDGKPVFEGDILPVPSVGGGVTELHVLFGKDLSVRDGTDGLDSVLNPTNWTLERGGVTMQGVITGVDFGFVPELNKYRAILHLDGDRVAAGTQGLPVGDYVLTVRDRINDNYEYDSYDDSGEYFLGNALDGDFDGFPGTRPEFSGYPGYKLRFSVSSTAQLGPEQRVNEVAPDQPNYVQVFGPSLGTGQAREESTQSVAVDHDGDYAVVWTSYGQDDPDDPIGGGVYMRLYDRASRPLTGEILVNQTVAGMQNSAAIAMDADGDFVVVWQSEGTSDDGSWDVFARRFNAVGTALSDEFRVNVETANNQLNPAVAMDYFGNFVVVWASESGSIGSYFNEIRGRLFDLKGEAVTTDFVVNDTILPAQSPQPGLPSTNPAVAMDPLGNFAVAWDQITAQTSGVITDSQIMAKFFDSSGTEWAPEFQADDGGGTGGGDLFRTARNPQLDLDENGNMTVVWEAFGQDDVGPTSYGVFFQQFELLITPDEDDPTLPPEVTITEGATGQVNLPDFAGEQVNPAVGVDA